MAFEGVCCIAIWLKEPFALLLLLLLLLAVCFHHVRAEITIDLTIHYHSHLEGLKAHSPSAK